MYLIVLFDISDPKRLRKVALTMAEYGTRVQESVFEVKTTTKKVKNLQNKIQKLIKNNDRVHYYPLCNKDIQKRLADGLGNIYLIPDYIIVN